MATEDATEYEACGTTRRRRVSRTEEAIEVMRLLWKEDNVTFHGQHFTLNNVTVQPKPVFPPDGMPPIWIGGRSEPALRRTARIGDGWLVSQATPDEVKDGVDKISTWAVEYDNDIEEDHYGVLTSFFIDDDAEGCGAHRHTRTCCAAARIFTGASSHRSVGPKSYANS